MLRNFHGKYLRYYLTLPPQVCDTMILMTWIELRNTLRRTLGHFQHPGKVVPLTVHPPPLRPPTCVSRCRLCHVFLCTEVCGPSSDPGSGLQPVWQSRVTPSTGTGHPSLLHTALGAARVWVRILPYHADGPALPILAVMRGPSGCCSPGVGEGRASLPETAEHRTSFPG